MSSPIDFRPVILAGGSGTRFWPRSRRAHAKQVLALDGERSMIQQTVERLKPLATAAKTWVITNEYLAARDSRPVGGRCLPGRSSQEPVARNTAPACGLAAFLIERQNPDAVLGVFPSDHVIADEPRFLKALHKGITVAAAGDNIVVLGIEPTRAETGYGYIETGDYTKDDTALHVRRFIEKPNQNRAEEFVAAGNYFWNSGMFLVVRADTGERRARASAGDRAAAGRNCRGLRNAPSSKRCFALSIPSVKTFPWTTRCSSRALPRASIFRISIACRRSSVGTTLAHGPRSTSTSLRRACAAMATATWPSPKGT